MWPITSVVRGTIDPTIENEKTMTAGTITFSILSAFMGHFLVLCSMINLLGSESDRQSSTVVYTPTAKPTYGLTSQRGPNVSFGKTLSFFRTEDISMKILS